MTLAGLVVTACGDAAPPSGRGTLSMAPGPSPAPTPAPAPPPEPVTSGLKDIAATRNLRFGSAYAWSAPGADAGSFANPDYAALIERDCSILVPENELKWQFIQPSEAPANFTKFDAMIDYAERRRIAVRGHNLLWHQPKWMPRWTETLDYGQRPAAEGERVLTGHIRTVMRRYKARIASWDVVNEAVNPADATLYTTALSRAIGGAEPTLDLAFRTAREEAPGAQLVYNDYMSWEPGNDKHRAGVLALLRGFKTRGVPVDALGVQSHIGLFEAGDVTTLIGRYAPAWRAFLDEVTGMGYALIVTELDVRDNALPVDIAVRDRAVADYARGYLDMMFNYPQLRDVLVWGLSDRYSWLQSFEPRADGAKRRPCPYDDQFHAKPLRSQIAAALSGMVTM